MSEKVFLKLMPTIEAQQFIAKHPKAFTLLYFIALRTNRVTGEAMIGDYEAMGMTRQEYRTALKILTKEQPTINQQTTIKTTNRGSFAKLISNTIIDINLSGSNQQPNQTSTTKQPLTKNKELRIKKEKYIKEKSLLHQEVEKICTHLSVTFDSLPGTFTVYENRYHGEDIKKKTQDACVWMVEKGKGSVLSIARLAHFLRDCPEKIQPKKNKTAEEMEEEFTRLTATV